MKETITRRTMPGDTTARASPSAKPPRWELLRALERVAPRFTLGDAMLQLPDYAGTADELRAAIVECAHLAGGWMEQSDGRESSDGPDASVVYVFPKNTRVAVMARSADAKRVAAQRRAWRGFLVALKAVFAFFLVASIVIVFMALVAMLIIMLTQGRDRGAGTCPSSGRAGPSRAAAAAAAAPGGRTTTGTAAWTATSGSTCTCATSCGSRTGTSTTTGGTFTRRARTATSLTPSAATRTPSRDAEGGVPAAAAAGVRTRTAAGVRTDPPFGGDPSGGPPAGDPSDLRRFVAEEDRDDATSRDFGSREMTFIESVFAFVFGRGDPNDDMEHRRWRAVSALLRVNRGAVFAEQVAPFLDEYLLGTNVANASDTNVLGSIANGITNTLAWLKSALAAVPSLPLPAATRRAWRLGFESRRDGAADAARMHEGYMTSVCARFGGHAEASEDGRLVYVFPALTVTTIDEENTPSRPALLPRRFPPLYERRRPVWEGGEKAGQVAALGALNLFLVVLFKRVGGADFRARRRPLGVRARAHDGAARAGGGGSRASVTAPGSRARARAWSGRIRELRITRASLARRRKPRAPRWRRRGRRAPTWTPPRAPRVGRSCTRPCLW